jgi:hypothetical protein
MGRKYGIRESRRLKCEGTNGEEGRNYFPHHWQVIHNSAYNDVHGKVT